MAKQKLLCVSVVTMLCGVSLAVASGTGQLPGTVLNELKQQQKWQSNPSGWSVPESGVSWTFDTASWKLESGTVRLMKPLSDGAVTGFVFEGRGRFTMSVPDAFEVAQLRRFSGDPKITAIDEPFTRLVFRTSGFLPEELESVDPGEAFVEDGIARGRHRAWLKDVGADFDALIIHHHLNGWDDFLLAGMDTESYGWVTYQNDPLDQEEITLTKIQKLHDWAENWVSLDAPDQRDEQGRPTSGPNNAFDITHVTFDIDLSEHEGSVKRSGRRVFRDTGHFRVGLDLASERDGMNALMFDLHSRAQLHSVQTAEGKTLEFLRDHRGGRFADIDNEVYDRDVVVILDETLNTGDAVSLVFKYDIEMYNYLSGRGWYPGLPTDVVSDDHTAELTFHLPRKFEVRCVGEEVKGSAAKDGGTSVWRVKDPTFMVGFSFGENFKEESIKADGIPEVIAFGQRGGLLSGNMVRNVAADVVNSINFYQWYFNFKLPVERMYATGITGSHGQAFDGFLHLSYYTFQSENPGSSELFRAHEVAHQMWGHMVRWGSYRDQWLSEAFAEYSAMLFIEATMQEKGFFEDILEAYTNEQIGSLKTVMSKFARPWDSMEMREDREHIGPIGAGYRAASAQVPNGYNIQVYRKGPLVLHMLRTLLQPLATDRDMFRAIMQEFLHTYNGRTATTEDFKALIEFRTGSDWTEFFDTWIYGCEIPTYKWDSDFGKDANGQNVVTLQVAQENVSPGFEAMVPVELQFGKDRASTIFVNVDQPEKTVVIPVSEKPSKVVFNSNFGVIARVKN